MLRFLDGVELRRIRDMPSGYSQDWKNEIRHLCERCQHGFKLFDRVLIENAVKMPIGLTIRRERYTPVRP